MIQSLIETMIVTPDSWSSLLDIQDRLFNFNNFFINSSFSIDQIGNQTFDNQTVSPNWPLSSCNPGFVDNNCMFLQSIESSFSVVEISFSFNWLNSLTVGYDVNITVADVNGNGNCTLTHVDGLAEGMIKALIKAWNHFVDEVKKIASAAFDWIWNRITNALNAISKPVIDAIIDFQKNMCELWTQISNIISSAGATDNVYMDSLSTMLNIVEFFITSPLLTGLIVLLMVIEVVELCIIVYTAGIGTLITSLISPFIKDIIVMALMAGISQSGLMPKTPSLTDLIFGAMGTPTNNGRADTALCGILTGIVVLVIAILYYIMKKDMGLDTAFEMWAIILSVVSIIILGAEVFATDQLTRTMLSEFGLVFAGLGVFLCVLSIMDIQEEAKENSGIRAEEYEEEAPDGSKVPAVKLFVATQKIIDKFKQLAFVTKFALVLSLICLGIGIADFIYVITNPI
jgi:hypothetical protein